MRLRPEGACAWCGGDTPIRGSPPACACLPGGWRGYHCALPLDLIEDPDVRGAYLWDVEE